jgi:tetratricopeptide repeat protein 19
MFQIHEQTVVLLNDLGTISFLMGEQDQAIDYLSKAIEIGRHLPNMEDFSSVYVNLGNIYLQKRMYQVDCNCYLSNPLGQRSIIPSF